MTEYGVANGVRAWWMSLSKTSPSIRYGRFLALSGGAARLLASLPPSRLIEREEARAAERITPERIGFRPELLNPDGETTEAVRRRIALALRGGRLPVLFTDSAEGVLYACQLSPFEVRARGLDIEGREWDEALGPDALRRWRLYAAPRMPTGLVSQRRVTLALLQACAEMRIPPEPALLSENRHGLLARGLEAYAFLTRGVEQGMAADPLRARLRWWLDVRTAWAHFLQETAGRGRSAHARRLRQAADLIHVEVESRLDPWTRPLSRLTRRRRESIAADLRAAGVLAARSLLLVLETALLRAGINPLLVSVLLEDPPTPIPPAALDELLYYARSGISPLRQLCARRLAGARDRASVETLTQLLFDMSFGVGESALHSLLQSAPDDLVPLLRRALTGVPRLRAESRSSLRPALLDALIRAGEAEPMALLETLGGIPPEERRLLFRIAARRQPAR